MDTLAGVQELFRLRALIRESPLSSGDVFGIKELHPGVRSPVVELTPQDTPLSPSWASPAKSANSAPEEPLPQATISIPKPFLRTLSRYSSLRPSRMLKSGSKGEGQAKEGDVSARRTVSAVTGTGLANHTKPRTIWTEHSFLPPAKPPPPLKHSKHARNHTEDNISPPNPVVPRQPSTSRSSGRSSGLYLTPPRPPRRSLDASTLEISSTASNQLAADTQHSLKRTTTRTTVTSEASNDTQTTFVPSNCSWKPPTSWAGPKATSADEDDRPKLLGWLTRKKSADNSKEGSMRASAFLSRVPSLRKLKSIQPADAGELVERRAPVIRGAPLPSGVAVKIQCSEGDGWHEKPMADIIPKLRKLRCK